MGDNNTVDPYGFERGHDFDYKSYEEFISDYLAVLARRSGKWSSFLSGEKNNNVQKSSKLKRYIRKGIPTEFRPKIWMQVSGAINRQRTSPNLFHDYLHCQHDDDIVQSIKTDVPRTFPDNIYFQNTPSDPKGKRSKLFNVLVALAHKNRKVGYCQGMNFIAGILLLVLDDEEKTFWLFDTLMQNITADYYSQDMIGIKVDQEVIGDLVRQKMPALHAHLAKHCVAWGLVSTKWLICLYADVLPIDTVLRIWDSLFYEGDKILFRVALTLIKQNEAKLMACESFPQIMDMFKQITIENTVLNCHNFMHSIFTETGSLSMSRITQLRKEWHKKVLADG